MKFHFIRETLTMSIDKNPFKKQLEINSVLTERKNHVFCHSAVKKLETV